MSVGRSGGVQLGPRGRRLLVAVAAVLALDATLYAALTPLLPSLRRELGASEAEAGLLVATYALGMLVGALPMAWLAPRLGPRRAMVLGLLVFAVASVGFGLADSILALDLMRGVQGVAAALTWAAGFAWLLAVGPREQHGLLIGSAISASVVGTLVGPALGALAVHVGRAGIFVAVGAAALTLSILLRWMPAPQRRGDFRLLPALKALARGAGAIGSWTILFSGLLVGVMVVAAPLRLDDLGAGAATIGAVFVVTGVSEVVLGPIVGRVSDRYGARLPMRAALIAIAGLLLALAAVSSLAATIVVIVLLLPGIIGTVTPAYAVLGHVATDRGLAVGAVFSAANLAWACGEGAGALGAGWLADVGRSDLGFLLLCALALGTVLLPLRARRHPAMEGPEYRSPGETQPDPAA